jgi:hypothetical protein
LKDLEKMILDHPLRDPTKVNFSKKFMDAFRKVQKVENFDKHHLDMIAHIPSLEKVKQLLSTVFIDPTNAPKAVLAEKWDFYMVGTEMPLLEIQAHWDKMGSGSNKLPKGFANFIARFKDAESAIGEGILTKKTWTEFYSRKAYSVEEFIRSKNGIPFQLPAISWKNKKYQYYFKKTKEGVLTPIFYAWVKTKLQKTPAAQRLAVLSLLKEGKLRNVQNVFSKGKGPATASANRKGKAQAERKKPTAGSATKPKQSYAAVAKGGSNKLAEGVGALLKLLASFA